MSIEKSVLIIPVFSLFSGLFMFFIALKNIPTQDYEHYAVIIADKNASDILITDLLPEHSISETRQWVFLDDFGKLTQIPLVEYENRLLDFDPRRDGYADKLRNFFVRDEKRFFFVPFEGVEKKIIHNKIPISDNWINKKRFEAFSKLFPEDSKIEKIIFFVYEEPILFYFLLFAITMPISMIFSFKPLFFMAIFPILIPLTIIGPAGFALSTALIGFYCIIPRIFFYKKIIGNILCLIAIFLWTAMFLNMPNIFSPEGQGILGKLGKDSLTIFGIPALFCVFGLGFLSSFFLKEKIKFSLIGAIIPFAFVSILSIFLPQTMGITTERNNEFIEDFFNNIVDVGEYENHVEFQENFSFIPLGSQSRNLNYMRYHLGEDGLISEISPYIRSEKNKIPPFPLEKLIAFFRNFKYSISTDISLPIIFLMGLIPIIIASCVYYMDFTNDRVIKRIIV